MRLAEQVAAANLSHLSSKIDGDLLALESYFEEKQDHHNRQASMFFSSACVSLLLC